MFTVGGIDRNKIDIMVHDKTFTISFVSVFARRSAVEYQQAVGSLVEIQLITNDKDRKKKLDELSIEDLEHKVKLREDIIENILTSNGYDFDSEWWDKYTSYSDQNEFIQYCMAKDVMEDKKKQEKA